MNVLVVDDEVLCAEGVKFAIDWQQIGVDQVLTAYSMQHAISILKKETVDIMITDVEMPKGSGFDLLEWLSQSSYDPLVIMLTSYATFDYAKQAIRYQAFDYILKPVSQETLLGVAKRAVAEVKNRQGYEETFEKAMYWDFQERQRIRNFWRSIVESTKKWDCASINAYAKQEHITFDEHQMYLPMILKIQNDDPETEWENERHPLKAAILEAVPQVKDLIVWMYNEKRLTIIIGCSQDFETLKNELHQFFAQYIRQNLKDNLRYSLYMGDFKASWEVAEQYIALRSMDENNVVQAAGVFEIGVSTEAAAYVRPDIETWMKLFLREPYETAMQRIDRDIDVLAHERRLDKENLAKLMQDFMQSFYIVMGEKEIEANLLLENKALDAFYKKAQNSVNDFKIWVHHILEAAQVQLDKISDETSILTEIRRFIKENLDQELSRKQIAEHVCMSQDYVSRIYRQATGQQLSEYITGLRMEEARRILAETSLPVGEVACKVGYYNVAYFSRVFRIRNGETPQEFRAKVKSKS